jgi:hypothetical protein
MTMTAERLEIALHGQVRKRGLIPRLPPADRVLADVEAWLRREYRDELLSLETTAEAVSARFHPAAPPIHIAVDGEGAVAVTGQTVTAGPGYHRFIGRALERLATDIGIDWTDAAAGLAFADRSAVERGYLGWLGPELARARVSVQRGARGVHIGMPAGTIVTCDAAIATVLGPRDEAWLDAAIADPRVAIEVTPWWSDATDGRYLVNRALVRMWLDVRWRRPAVSGEGALLDEIHGLLSRAYPLEPDLTYPWPEWGEVVAFRGLDDAMARQVIARAAQAQADDPGAARIGYRRAPVTIRHEGWVLTVPGDFAERRTADEWWGGGPGRNITLAATATGTGSGRMTAQGFLSQVAADLGPEALHHEAGEVRGRARITTDASSGLEIGVVEGFAAVTGSGAVIRIEFDDGEDYAWALDMWRSLRPG